MNPLFTVVKAFITDTALYLKYIGMINIPMLRESSVELYKIFKVLALYKQEDLQGTVSDFSLFFFGQYLAMKPDEIEVFISIFQEMEDTVVSERMILEYLEAYKTKETASKIAKTALEVASGRGSFQDIIELTKSVDELRPEEPDVFVTNDLQDIYEQTIHRPGLRWRLNTLNKMLGSLRQGNFGFVFARPEVGKCFGKGTEILMFDGSTLPVECLSIDDLLMGDDSTPRRVLSTCQGKEQMYRISYPWGESYVVNESHILSLKRSKTNGSKKNGDILNVELREYLTWTPKKKLTYKGWKTGVEFPRQEYSIPPYLLGLWLGDGTSTNTSFTNADPEIIQSLQRYAEFYNLKCNIFERKNQGKAKTIALSGSKGKKNAFREQLRAYRIFGNKHIPDEYLRNSRGVRLQVLAGLIDTDGSVTKQGYEITQVRKHLAQQILWLVRSLGFHGTLHEKLVGGVSYWRVTFFGDVASIPCIIPRKKLANSLNPKRKGLHFAFTVTKLEANDNDYYGFTLDRNHLFVLGDFTVAHNTTFLASEATCMAEQLEALKEPGDILWVNNEESGKVVMSRCYQAALGLSTKQLYENIEHNREDFIRLTGGRIKILDDANANRKQIDLLCKKLRPKLIILDQIDKIRGFENDRYDLKMKDIYQWARELAKLYGPTIGTCQAGGTGEGKKWLQMNDVDSSHTAKQGEADFMLGIGKVLDENYESQRYLCLSKNKLPGDEDTLAALRHGKCPVTIKPDLARYEDKLHWDKK